MVTRLFHYLARRIDLVSLPLSSLSSPPPYLNCALTKDGMKKHLQAYSLSPSPPIDTSAHSHSLTSGMSWGVNMSSLEEPDRSWGSHNTLSEPALHINNKTIPPHSPSIPPSFHHSIHPTPSSPPTLTAHFYYFKTKAGARKRNGTKRAIKHLSVYAATELFPQSFVFRYLAGLVLITCWSALAPFGFCWSPTSKKEKKEHADKQ